MQSRSDSCPVSIDTVQAVYRCPETEEEWKKAMERKNCSSYAKMCDEPYRLVYHCVINSYINQLIEVCAYTQNIVGGYCTEYSISGNLIQQDFLKTCWNLTINPCPRFYVSDESYKYSACYKLNSTSSTTLKPNGFRPKSTTSMINMSTEENSSAGNDWFNNGEETKIDIDLLIICVLITIAVILSGILVLYLLVRRARTNREQLSSTMKENTKNEEIERQVTQQFIRSILEDEPKITWYEEESGKKSLLFESNAKIIMDDELKF